MNFGYLLFVKTSQNTDYLKLGYALALSIKHTQKPGYDKVALVIDDPSLLKKLNSAWVFDHVIEWGQEDGWDGRSWMDHLTPFDYTVCLDADMLFLRDYSHWIDYFIENTDLYVCNKSYTYRDEIVTNRFYRKTFVESNLPDLYSFYTFFKKNDMSLEFFSMGRYIIKNQDVFANLYLKHRPSIVGTDEAFALAAKILDIQDQISYELDFPKIVHLKPMVQNWPWQSDRVTDHVGFYFNEEAQLKIGNYKQDSIIHYVEKELMTDEYINILEELVWNKN
jgi:hypothetical protein